MKHDLTKASVLVASANQVSADLTPDQSGEVVILGLKDGVYFELNEVGSCIWRLLQQPRSIQSLLDTLLEEYDVSAEQCEADMLALVDDMMKHGLVETGDGPNP